MPPNDTGIEKTPPNLGDAREESNARTDLALSIGPFGQNGDDGAAGDEDPRRADNRNRQERKQAIEVAKSDFLATIGCPTGGHNTGAKRRVFMARL
jgi:hypothetical protein